MKTTFFLCFLIVFVTMCSTQNGITKSDPIDKANSVLIDSSDYDLSSYIDTTTAVQKCRNDAFDYTLFKKIVGKDSLKNVMVSPLSVVFAFSVFQNGAKGATWDSVTNSLGFGDFTQKELNSYMVKLSNVLQSDSNIDLEIANSVWAKEGIKWSKLFFDLSEKYYNSDVSYLTTADKINEWVQIKTKDKIKTIVDNISNDIAMIIVNAVYFNGVWLDAFDEEKSVDAAFFVENSDSVNVNMMKKNEKIFSKENNLYKAIKLPYKDKKTFAYIFLPKDGISMKEMYSVLFSGGDSYIKFTVDPLSYEKKDSVISIDDANMFSDFYKTRYVRLSVPSFKFEYNNELSDELKQMGMGIIFNSPDLTGLTKDVDLFVSGVNHKTYIDFNEKGTEAAALTSITFSTSLSPLYEIPAMEFNANKPFFFVIRNDELKQNLFMGQVINPCAE